MNKVFTPHITKNNKYESRRLLLTVFNSHFNKICRIIINICLY